MPSLNVIRSHLLVSYQLREEEGKDTGKGKLTLWKRHKNSIKKVNVMDKASKLDTGKEKLTLRTLERESLRYGKGIKIQSNQVSSCNYPAQVG